MKEGRKEGGDDDGVVYSLYLSLISLSDTVAKHTSRCRCRRRFCAAATSTPPPPANRDDLHLPLFPSSLSLIQSASKMPAWWSRSKAKLSTPRPKSSPRSPPAAATKPPPEEKEKSGGYEEVFVFSSPRALAETSPTGRSHGHPLPLPPDPPPDQSAAAAAASAVSSAASSFASSSDENPDPGSSRHSEPIVVPSDRNGKFGEGHPVASPWNEALLDGLDAVYSRTANSENTADNSVSPRREFRLDGLDVTSVSPRREFRLDRLDVTSVGVLHSRCRPSAAETIYGRRSVQSAPGSRGHHPFHTSPTSPIHQRFSTLPEYPISRHDEPKSPLHPLPLPPSPPSSSVPPLQSSWKKGKLLGRGTFGHVYQGFNSEGGRMCAIKEVTHVSDDANSKECLRQLSQEISVLSQLSHSNIVQYYGSELVEDKLCVYLEYVSGGSIHRLLQEYGPFRENVIRNYTGQILAGLSYLHGRNTVHRDIKGANILVDPNGEIKLVDFGMAKHISSYTSIHSFKGSPYWMAPEVIMNASGYNSSVDIWSLGCTIIEMATSKPPWSQYEGVAAIFKIGNSRDIPEIPDHLSSEGKDFLRLCLRRDPSTRPTAAYLMDHPFVRSQGTMKVAKINISRDHQLPLPSESSCSTATFEFSPRRSISPLRDGDLAMRWPLGFFDTGRMNSEVVNARTNMSLPVSPCSSPLRQFRQANWSRLPSPPHPTHSVATINLRAGHSLLPSVRPSGGGGGDFQMGWNHYY